MTPELIAFTLVALLQVLQCASMALPANIETRQGKIPAPRNRDRQCGSLEDKLGTRAAYSRNIGSF